MQIRFKNLTLADGTRDKLVSNIRVNGTKAIQSVEFIRGHYRHNYDRQNTATEVSFTLAWLMTSIINAEITVISIVNQIFDLGKGSLIFTGHQNDYQTSLENAIARSVNARHIGRTVFIDCVFSGENWD